MSLNAPMILERRGWARSYNGLAWLYDRLGAVYSGGAMARLRCELAGEIGPSERVLYAGVGSGLELGHALARGAAVTAVDRSRGMLARARRYEHSGNLTLLCESVFEHRPGAAYDTVVASFFLNVFSPEELPLALQHLARLLKPGGRLLIADFAPPPRRTLERIFQALYYFGPLLFFRLLTNNGWHAPYDYAKLTQGLGLELRWTRRRRIFSWGPRWLSALELRTRGETR